MNPFTRQSSLTGSTSLFSLMVIANCNEVADQKTPPCVATVTATVEL
mgnify:CR=1